jgi:lysozyme
MASLPNLGLAARAAKPLRWLAACAVLVGGFEGLSTTAYHDKLARGLPTVCYGETEGVHMGDHYTVLECHDLLARKLERYWHDIEPCILVQTSDNEKIAYTSFSYNLGVGAFCKSSFLKKLNTGDHKDACNGMLAYDTTRSMGVVPGLVKRRHKEDKVCLTIAQEGPALRIVPLNEKPFDK